jgi:hypothetical protein
MNQLQRQLPSPFYSYTPRSQQLRAKRQISSLKTVTSAAFPTIGNMINPINVVDTPEDATIASIELTKNSAHTATTAVDASKRTTATRGVISATSWDSLDSASAEASSYKCECVFN